MKWCNRNTKYVQVFFPLKQSVCVKEVNWSSELPFLFLKQLAASSPRWWAMHSFKNVSVITVSQITAITDECFRAKREKHRSEVSSLRLSQPRSEAD